MRDEARIPHIGDQIRPEIAVSAWETDRWHAFRLQRPARPDPQVMGLEGRAYEGYQPPL